MNIAAMLGIEMPVIQAPMGGAQGSAMAIAVSAAGALGSLSCVMLAPGRIREEIAAIRSATDKPYNVNFFCHAPPVPDALRDAAWRQILQPYFNELGIEFHSAGAGLAPPFSSASAELLAEFKPPVVSFHFGLPTPDLLMRVRSWGAKVLSSATTVEEARWLERQGVDAIIAQGSEAGGHRGMFLTADLTTQTGTFALLPQVVRAVRVPVIAAGGVADADGVAAALALGAAGVQAGTAYLLCPEATITPLHRAALKGARAGHTALTNVFTGRPARAIVNRAIRELGPVHSSAPEFPLAAAAIAILRSKCERLGSDDFSPLWCGQNPLACSEVPAAERTRQLAGLAA